MKTKVHRRLARVAGLLALSLFVLAIAAQAAQAASVQGSGAVVLSSEVTVQSQAPVTDGWLIASATASDGWLTAGGATAQSGATLPQPSANRVPGTHPRPGIASDGWSTADWVGTGLVAAALFIAGLTAWALLRRSRPLGEPASVTSIAPPRASSPPQPVSEEDTQRRAA